MEAPIPAKVLALVVLLLAAASAHGRELDRQLPGDPSPDPSRLVRAAGNQFTPATATDGRDYIAVWVEARIESQIYMTVIRRNGDVVAPRSILLSGSLSRCKQPAVTWNGSSYLVAWAHFVDQEGWRISLVRVSSDGRLLDATPRTVTSAGASVPNDFGPMLASNGDSSLLYAPVESPPGLRVVALDKDANVVDSQDFRQGSDGLVAYRMVPLGGHYALVVNAFDDVMTRAVTLTGNRLLFGDLRFVEHVDDSFTRGDLLGAVSDGQRALIVYDTTDPGQVRLFARTITAAEVGPRVEVRRTDLLRSASGSYYTPIPSAALATDRSGFTLVWRSVSGEILNPALHGPLGRGQDRPATAVATYATLAARFDSSGQLRSTTTLVAGGGYEDDVSIASNGGSLFTLWNETLLRYPVVYKLAAGLWDFRHDLNRLEIAFSRPGQGTPRIAAGTNGYLVVWREEPQNDGFGVIMAQRRDRDGNAMGASREMSSASGNQLAPRVAFNGREYLVAWIDGGTDRPTIVGRAMATDGQLLDEEPAVIADSFFGTSFALASNGADFAVAYASPYPFENSLVSVARITSPLAVTTTQSIWTGDAALNSEVEIAASGGDYVVGWSTGRWPVPATVAAASLSSGGPGQRIESFWPNDPVMACVDVSCLALAYRSLGSLNLTALAFRPSEIPTSPGQAELSWNDGARLTSRGREFLAAGKVRDAAGSSLRAQYLSPDGAPASDEIRIVEQVLIGEFDVAMSDGGFAVAYIAPARVDVAPRIVVKTMRLLR